MLHHTTNRLVVELMLNHRCLFANPCRRWNILHHTTNCPVVELVLNHRCFAQTIENLFTLAFLVRGKP